MTSSWIARWALHPIASVLITDTLKGGVNTEAEMGETQPPAKVIRATRCWKRRGSIPPKGLQQRASPCQLFDSGPVKLTGDF